MFCVICGSIIFSSVLAIGESRAIGLYVVPMDGSLLGFGMGIIFAVFQFLGILFALRDVL